MTDRRMRIVPVLRAPGTGHSGDLSAVMMGRAPRSASGLRRHLMACVLTIGALLTVTGTRAPAHGDPGGSSSAAGDGSFLAALDAADIDYDDPGKVIRAGQMMCTLVDHGKTGKALISILQKHNDSLTTERALQFMAISFQFYCPQNFAAGMTGPTPQEKKQERQEEEELTNPPI